MFNYCTEDRVRQTLNHQTLNHLSLKITTMKTLIKLTTLACVILIGSSFSSHEASLAKWFKLGAKNVSYKLDRDVIYVGAKRGGFTKLKLEVTRGNLNMHKMVVEYRNGSKDIIPLKYNFMKGSDTRVIDLEGGKRIIKDITMWYDTKNYSGQMAKVHVYGRR